MGSIEPKSNTGSHTKNNHSSFKAAFNGGYISSLYKKICVGLLHSSAQTISSVFSHPLVSVAFGQE